MRGRLKQKAQGSYMWVPKQGWRNIPNSPSERSRVGLHLPTRPSTLVFKLVLCRTGRPVYPRLPTSSQPHVAAVGGWDEIDIADSLSGGGVKVMERPSGRWPAGVDVGATKAFNTNSKQHTPSIPVSSQSQVPVYGGRDRTEIADNMLGWAEKVVECAIGRRTAFVDAVVPMEINRVLCRNERGLVGVVQGSVLEGSGLMVV